MNINSLPDILLQQVFSALPLGSILGLHQVCTKWASIQRSICSKKDKICIIVGSFESVDRYSFDIPCIEHISWPPSILIDSKVDFKDNQLHFDWLDSNFAADLIVKYLPNVTALHISLQMVPVNKHFGERSWNHTENIIEPLTILVQSWATQLEVIEIFTNAKEEYLYEKKITNFYISFLGLVNNCTSLKKLVVESNNSIQHEKPTVDLPVLSWIEKLDFNFFDFNGSILANLLKYSLNNENLKSINFTDFYKPDFEFFLENKNSHLLTSKFHQLVNYNLCINNDDADTFLKNFKFIQRLHFRVYTIDEIDLMIKNLYQLKYLLYAEMYIGFENSDWNRLTKLNINNDPKLSLDSVKILRVYAPLCCHVTIQSFHWHEIFPSLDVLYYVDGENCYICNEIVEETENEDVIRKECLRKTLKAWLKCCNLRTIISQSPGDINVFWSIDDLKKTD